jgi:hypothetical protein
MKPILRFCYDAQKQGKFGKFWASPIQRSTTQPCQVRKEAASGRLECVI